MAPRWNKKLLVIDDDKLFCELVSIQFASAEIQVLSAHTGREGRQICAEQKIDVVLLDQKLPDMLGIELCRPILAHNDAAKIIFITAYASFEHAVKAIKAGAHDYLSKPFENEELILAVAKAFRTLAMEQAEQIQNYNRKQENSETILIGSGPAFAEIRQLIRVSAVSNAPVLITGATGTGKNVIAKSIHYMDQGRHSAFIGINCAALPENLIEAELFGYEKGAFTGASTAGKGIFEMAEGGTLFLDEIGEIPFHLQSKLLGVLDEKKVRRIGGNSMRPIDVRIIAATNSDLEKAVESKQFRSDLYYRLSVIRIHIPPLKERLEDIPELISHFMRTFSPTPEILLAEDEIAKLQSYHWPGNVRELKNIIERAVILRSDNHITPSRLIGPQLGPPVGCGSGDLATSPLMTLEEMEKIHIRNTLTRLSHNHTRTAEALGVSRSTLMRKMKQYDLH